MPCYYLFAECENVFNYCWKMWKSLRKQYPWRLPANEQLLLLGLATIAIVAKATAASHHVIPSTVAAAALLSCYCRNQSRSKAQLHVFLQFYIYVYIYIYLFVCLC